MTCNAPAFPERRHPRELDLTSAFQTDMTSVEQQRVNVEWQLAQMRAQFVRAQQMQAQSSAYASLERIAREALDGALEDMYMDEMPNDAYDDLLSALGDAFEERDLPHTPTAEPSTHLRPPLTPTHVQHSVAASSPKEAVKLSISFMGDHKSDRSLHERQRQQQSPWITFPSTAPAA